MDNSKLEDKMDPAIIAALINAAASIGSGVFGRERGSPLTDIQKNQNNIIELIMQAVRGEGPLAGLINADENAFQQSVANPLLNQFQNQTVPAIQQSFIKNRLQGGTGINDAIARSGINLQDMINKNLLDYQSSRENNLVNLLNAALKAQGNEPKQGESAFTGGLRGGLEFLADFDLQNLLKTLNQNSQDSTAANNPTGTSSQGFQGGAFKEEYGR